MNRDSSAYRGDGDSRPFDPGAYGRQIGTRYDGLYPAEGLETDATVEFVATLAKRHEARSVLEFGIGTGRLGLALLERGVRVAGIDASTEMVAALRAKAPEAEIPVAIGDYASTHVEGAFAVVALVFNNILDSRGLAAQLEIFTNARRHLAPGGHFVIEAFVLLDDTKDGSWRVAPRYVGTDHVELQMARFDIGTSTVERTLVHLRPEGLEFITVRDTYAAPGELDVMAHVSGLARVARYSDWKYSPFTSQSRRHVSVYRRD